jgi:hypothetical protein
MILISTLEITDPATGFRYGPNCCCAPPQRWAATIGAIPDWLIPMPTMSRLPLNAGPCPSDVKDLAPADADVFKGPVIQSLQRCGDTVFQPAPANGSHRDRERSEIPEHEPSWDPRDGTLGDRRRAAKAREHDRMEALQGGY